MPLSTPLSLSQQIAFHALGPDCEDFRLVRDIFDKPIAKLYGDQTAAVDKIKNNNDRLCEGLYIDGLLKGIIVFKKSLDGKKRLELKTLYVRQPELNRGKGYGTKLLTRLLNVAEMRMADGIKVTVSSKVPKVLSFYESMGFTVYRSEKGHYPGTQEHCLSVKLSELKSKLAKKQSKKSHPPVASGQVASASSAVSAQSNKTELSPDQSLQSDRIPRKKSTSSLFSPSNHHKRSRPSDSGSRASQGKYRTCTLMAKYVRQIESGYKTWEGRCNTNLFRNYNVGDTVKWFAGSVASVTTEIVAIKNFNSFSEMVKNIGHKALVNETRSDEECIRVYNRIPGYSDKARRFGVVAFQLKVVSPQSTSRNRYDEPSAKRVRY